MERKRKQDPSADDLQRDPEPGAGDRQPGQQDPEQLQQRPEISQEGGKHEYSYFVSKRQ